MVERKNTTRCTFCGGVPSHFDDFGHCNSCMRRGAPGAMERSVSDVASARSAAFVARLLPVIGAMTVQEAQNVAWHDRVNGDVQPVGLEALRAALQALDAELERRRK